MAAFLQSDKTALIVCYVGLTSIFIYQIVANLLSLLVPRRLYVKRKIIAGQKVLITGAGSGLGRQLAVEFSKHAACLLLVDIDIQSLLLTKKLLDHRSTVFAYQCDVSDYKKVCEMAEKVKKDAGDVDILVNNAGIVSGQYIVDLSEDKIRRTMEVNTLAHFWTVKTFLPAMIERNSGHIVSITSVAGKVGLPKLVDYCASKYAAVGLAECLELELREQNLNGIKFTIVYPSKMSTGLFDGAKVYLGELMTPEYVAKEVILGVLEERETIYLPQFIRILHMCKESAPRWLVIKLADLTGNLHTMDHFTGRQNSTVNKTGKTA